MLKSEQTPAEEKNKVYAASIIAKHKPAAVFIPLDILQAAKKNYTLSHLVDDICTLANMPHADFTATFNAGKYAGAIKALDAAIIASK